jgi:hypothetical protein
MDLLPGWRDTSKYSMNISNLLLDALPIGTQRRLLSSCDTVELQFNTRLSEAGSTMRFAYFPLTSFVSLVTVLEERRALEVGLIGNEGMLGATVALGTSTSPLTTIVQGAGSALRLKIASYARKSRATKPWRICSNAISSSAWCNLPRQAAACVFIPSRSVLRAGCS